MGQASQRADQVGVEAEIHGAFTRADFQVATHAGGQVDDDVHVGLANTLHHFTVQRHIAAELAGFGVADMAMHHGGAGLRRFHRGEGDLLGRDRDQMALARGVAGTGQCARDDDVVVHVQVPLGKVFRACLSAPRPRLAADGNIQGFRAYLLVNCRF
ncbi:hypothetical protein D3C80_1394720 [compost metagenome]